MSSFAGRLAATETPTTDAPRVSPWLQHITRVMSSGRFIPEIDGLRFIAIAAVVLGGTSLMGGRGSVASTIIGAFVIGVLADGLILLGVSQFWQIVVKGLVIVAAVILDQLQQRYSRRAAAALRN